MTTILQYEHTDEGDIPEGWNIKSLEEVAEIHDKKRVPLSKAERSKKQGIYPYCGANGVIDYINDYIFEGEYVLIAEDGGFWNKYENTAYLMTGKFWVNNHAHIIKAIKNKTINKYLLYWFIFENVEKYTSGSTRKKLTQSVLRKIKIPLPPLSEQHNIAYILSTVQEAIEKTDAVIRATKLLKRSLMEHLFTYGPVPITQREKVKLKETEIGLIPEEWEIIELDKVGKIITGTTPSTKKREYYGSKYMFISPGDMGFSKYIKQTEKYLSEEGLKVSRILPSKTVLMVCIGATIGKTGLTFAEKSATNQQINAIITNTDFNSEYIYYALTNWSKDLVSFSSRAAVPIVNKSNFSKFKIPLPSKTEQEKISKILSIIDLKIENEIIYRNKLQELFKSLLENLMTGKLRVKDLNFEQINNKEIGE